MGYEVSQPPKQPDAKRHWEDCGDAVSMVDIAHKQQAMPMCTLHHQISIWLQTAHEYVMIMSWITSDARHPGRSNGQ